MNDHKLTQLRENTQTLIKLNQALGQESFTLIAALKNNIADLRASIKALRATHNMDNKYKPN